VNLISFIAAGAQRLLFLQVKRTESPQIKFVTVGDNDFGQLGDSDFLEERGGPLEIPFPLQAGAFADAAAGWNHTIILFGIYQPLF
jgi:hypothetical protein